MDMSKHKTLFFALLATCFVACSSDNGEGNFSNKPTEPPAVQEESSSEAAPEESSSSEAKKVIDYSRAVEMNKKIGRGINMGNTFDADCETCWGAGPIEKQQVQAIAKAGFNSVRLPVRWDKEASKTAPYTINPDYLARVKEVLKWINGEGLVAIINIHHHQSFLTDVLPGDLPNPDHEEMHLTRVDSIWRQVADYYSDFSNDSLIFEMFNEPRAGVSAEAHNKMIARTFPIMRKNNPGRTIMYGSHTYNAYAGIKKLVLPEDGNIIFTPHYYVPANYALQGEGGKCGDNPKTWEGTSSEVKAMKEDFDYMTKLRDELYPGLPINIGEFGATYCGGIKSRVKWVTNFVKFAKEKGISWNYWGFTRIGGYEIYDKVTDTWSDTETLDALLKTN